MILGIESTVFHDSNERTAEMSVYGRDDYSTKEVGIGYYKP